jgi:deoxyribonuclease V
MKIGLVHEWNLDRQAAEKLQTELRHRVVTTSQLGAVRTVAGIDTGFHGDVGRSAIVVLAYPSLETLAISTSERPVTFPYIPGLLSFREAPVILAAAEQVGLEPDLIIVDGQGIAHPRRFGIACHIGVLLDRPTIGCAKSRLVGQHDQVGPNPGDFAYLYDRKEVVGVALRTKKGSNPLYVSIGNKVDLPAAIQYVIATCRGYRLPEPTRRAHLAAAGRLSDRASATQQPLI